MHYASSLSFYSLLLLALTLLSLHSLSPAFRTILPMLFPTLIGRASGIWHSQHNFTQFQSLLNSGSRWSFLPRAPVSPLFGAGFRFLYQQCLSVWPEEVLWLLLATWKNSSVWLIMPDRRVDIVSLCDIFGQHCSTFNNQGLSLCSLLTAYWARLCRSSGQLSAVTTST